MDPLHLATSIPAKVWSQALDEAAPISGGRKYIVLNSDNKLQVQEKASGGRKLKFREIAAITNNFIEKFPHYKGKMTESLTRLAERVVQKYESKSTGFEKLKGLFIKSSYVAAKSLLSEKISSKQELVGIPPSRASSEEIIEFSKSVENVTESSEGRFGVAIFDAPTDRRVVKFILDPVQPIVAEWLFEQMEIENTHAIVISNESPEGKALLAKFDQNFDPVPESVQKIIDEGKNNPEKMLSSLSEVIKNHPSHKMQGQRQLFKHMLFMNYLQATSWGQSLESERKRAIADPAFCQELGKMILVDALIGENDRLNEKGFSSGNLMILKQKEKSRIGLVDSNAKINSQSAPEIGKNLRRLLSDEGPKICEELAETVVRTLTGNYNIQNISKNMYVGIIEGARQILPLLSNLQPISQLLQNLPPSNNIDLKKLEEFKGIIQEQLQAMRLL